MEKLDAKGEKLFVKENIRKNKFELNVNYYYY